VRESLRFRFGADIIYFALKAESDTLIYAAEPGSNFTFVYDFAGRLRQVYFQTSLVGYLHTIAHPLDGE
jgi:hypothetical protein